MRTNTKWLLVGLYMVLRGRCRKAIMDAPSQARISKGVRIGKFAFEVEIDREGIAVIPKLYYLGDLDNSVGQIYYSGITEREVVEIETYYTARALTSEPPKDIIGTITNDLNALAEFAINGWNYEEAEAKKQGYALNYYTINRPQTIFNNQNNGDRYMISGPLDVASELTGVTMSVRQNPQNLHNKYISADIDVTISREIKYDELFNLGV